MHDINPPNKHLERHLLPAEWDNALCALQGHQKAGLGWVSTGKHNPKLLAELLLSGQPVPDTVIKIIGQLLSPPRSYIGGRLKFSPAGKQAKSLLARKINAEKAYALLNQMKAEGMSHKKAQDEVVKGFGMSISAVQKLKPQHDTDFIEEMQRRLNPDTMLP